MQRLVIMPASIETPDPPRLLKGIDPNKDQSYFLHGLKANALENSIFPLGHLTKSEVRNKAKSTRIAKS